MTLDKAINEKIKKNEPRKEAVQLFLQFGTILDVVALKTIKMRSEALISLKDGYPFYDKALKIAYSREKSHVISRPEGSLKGSISASKWEDDVDGGHSSKRVANGKQQEFENDSGSDMEASDDNEAPPQIIKAVTNSGDDPDARKCPTRSCCSKTSQGVSRRICCGCFQQYLGFKDVHLVSSSGGKGTGDVGFVEYENELETQVAEGRPARFKLAQNSALSVFFAKWSKRTSWRPRSHRASCTGSNWHCVARDKVSALLVYDLQPVREGRAGF
ncbi:hypothetical protein BJ742DRAFT_822496, partial [Cladochytrium replicatum]